MNSLDFLRAVTGTDGHYCLWVRNAKSGTIKQLFYEQLDALYEAAVKFDAQNYDAYFALGTYIKSGSRKADNVQQMRALFLDLDCGEGRPYLNKVEAHNALVKFCKRLRLPRPLLVDSGGGIHVYWPLTDPVPSEEWLPVAKHLKQLCISHSLFADESCTADAARILRIPVTHNYKEEPPRPVTLLSGSEAVTANPLEFFRKTLEVPETVTPVELVMGAEGKNAPAGISAVGQQLRENTLSSFKKIVRKSLRGNGCEHIANMLLSPETVSEPMWRAGLSIAVHCDDGDVAIHKLSEGHEGYSSALTEKKARAIKGPYLCSRFDEGAPGICARCALKGKIKSPISIGRELAIAAPASAPKVSAPKNEEVTGLDSTMFEMDAGSVGTDGGTTLPDHITLDDANKLIVRDDGAAIMYAPAPNFPKSELQEYVLPKLPSSYFRGKAGGIYKVVTNEEGEMEHIPVSHHELYVTRRIYEPENGESVLIRVHFPKDGVREFPVYQHAVFAEQKLKEELAKRGVTATGRRQWDLIGGYIVDWINELQKRAVADNARNQFGWSKDMSSFFLGSKEYTSSGKVNYNPAHPATLQLFPSFDPQGSVEEWTKLMDVYSGDGMEIYQLVLGFGFGAPLMALTPYNGFTLHLNGDTGYGKTTVQLAALSIWGFPEGLTLDDKDTPNSKMNRLEVVKNIFTIFDEMTNTKPIDLSDIAYKVASGRQKNRMSSGSNQERVRGDAWATLVVSSGNMSWHARIDSVKVNADAEKERVFEITLADYVQKGKLDMENFLMEIKHNQYGTAADPYLRYIVSNLDTVKGLFIKVQTKLDLEAGFDNKNRFRSAGFAAAITGLIIAKNLNLVSFDPSKTYKYLLRLIKDDKARSATERRTAEDVLNDYLAEHWNDILRINSTVRLARGKTTVEEEGDSVVVPYSTPRGPMVARYEPDVGKLYVLKRPFRLWCSKQQLNHIAIFDTLAKQYKVSSGKVRVERGTHLKMSGTGTDVYIVDWTLEEDTDEGGDADNNP